MIFKQLNNFSLVATFFALWLAVFFEDVVEDVFAYILIFTFGILHGANDLKLISHSDKAKPDSKQSFLTFLYYVLFVLGCALLFYFLASFALLFFVLFSAYHFGEQHWSHKFRKTIGLNGIFYTSYGLLLLLLLFTSHSAEVSDIIKEIAGISVHNEFYRYTFWLSILTTSILYGIIQKSKVLTWITLKEFFYICLFLLVFSTASLLWSFAIYFILWHSLPSMLDQIRYLYGDYSKKHMLRYVMSSSLYWIVSITALAFLFLFFKKTDQTFLALFFSFLAALTFPHVLVITKLYKN